MTAPSPVPQLLSVMIDGRLLLAESADGRATVTLIHEALIEEWPTLGRWLERDRTQMQRVQRQLQLLASPVDGDRKYAVTALGQIGPSAPEVIPAILSTFSNSKERALIRVAAAEAWGHIGLLRQIGSAAPDVAGYVNPVAAALIAVICDRKDKVTVRSSAQHALGALGLAGVPMTLAAAVGDGEKITDDQIVTDLMTVVDGVRETDKVRVNLAKSHGIGNPPIFLEETPGLETKVKDAARRIWEKFGEPRGRDQEIWNRARAQIYLENLTRPSIPISARNSFGDDDNGGDDRTK